MIRVLRVARLRRQASSHDDDALRQFGEVRIDRERQSDVGQGTGSIKGDLVRVRVYLPYQKVRSIFLQRCYTRRTLLQGRNRLRSVVRLVAGVVLHVAPRTIPGKAACP